MLFYHSNQLEKVEYKIKPTCRKHFFTLNFIYGIKADGMKKAKIMLSDLSK